MWWGSRWGGAAGAGGGGGDPGSGALPFVACGTVGGRCFSLRVGEGGRGGRGEGREGVQAWNRCFVPCDRAQRADLTSVGVTEWGAVVTGDSAGQLSVVDAATGRFLLLDHLTTGNGAFEEIDPKACAVVGGQGIGNTHTYVYAYVLRNGMSWVRWARGKTESRPPSTAWHP